MDGKTTIFFCNDLKKKRKIKAYLLAIWLVPYVLVTGSPHEASPDARAAAVILLKNMVRVRWKTRGGRGSVVGEGEKASLRAFLLGQAAMEEPHDAVAAQVSLAIFWNIA